MKQHDFDWASDVLDSFGQSSILVVGDIMLDRFVYGHVNRISPESPVPVLRQDRENVMLGGAGNALSNLCHLKCPAKILSVVGNDPEGEQIKSLVDALDGDTSGLVFSPERRTTIKTRFLAGHQQLLRCDQERVEPFSNDVMVQLLEKARDLIPQVRVMILSDYGKGLLSESFIKDLIALAKEHSVSVLVDPKGQDYSIYRGADVVTPNKKELSEATSGASVDTDDHVTNAARHLINYSGIGAVLATRSQDGMSVVRLDDVSHIKSSQFIEVFDVSGAGDTVIATVAAVLASGADLVKAAQLANLAGSIVVSKVGTAPIRMQELRDAVDGHDGVAIQENSRQPNIERVRHAPVFSWTEAREEILRWQARGLKVGFTNGCFDIVHLGHVTYLNDARRKCDRLIVGLNSDSSVRVLKGEERPVHGEESRSAVLAALGSVDMVVLFGAKKHGDDNTACALLDQLQPDLYFKGGDYTVDQIPEAPTVMAYGGQVDVLPVYEGHSTTSSIEKVKKGAKAA